MRIIAFTDLHSNPARLKHLEDLIKLKKPDIILCPGDISYFGRNLNAIAKILDSFNIPILIIPGNHESDNELTLLEKNHKNFKNIHGCLFNLNNVQFFGYGGGGFAKLDPRLEKIINNIKENIDTKNKFIILSHAPPSNTLQDLVNHDHVGSESLRKFIEATNPVLVIVGHIHDCEHTEDKIKNSRIINPGDGEIITI